jgi:hypothetical protein
MLKRVVLSLGLMIVATTDSYADSIVMVPKDTKISIVMRSNLSSVTSATGDNFSALVCEDVAVDGKLVWPAGTRIGGRLEVTHSRHMDRSSSVRLIFTSIGDQGGPDTKICASLVVRGGIITFRRGDEIVKIDAATFVYPDMAINPPVPTSVKHNTFESDLEKTMCSTLLLGRYRKDVDIKIGDETRMKLQKDLQVTLAESENSSLYLHLK